jgi:hypothetical protein
MLTLILTCKRTDAHISSQLARGNPGRRLMAALHLHSRTRTPEDQLLVPDRINNRLTDTS